MHVVVRNVIAEIQQKTTVMIFFEHGKLYRAMSWKGRAIRFRVVRWNETDNTILQWSAKQWNAVLSTA